MASSTRPIHNVAILGATGALGHALVPSLQNAGFHITCISRQESTSPPPKDVDSISADYESVDSLRNAFRDQDAVVEAFNPSGAVAQRLIVQAALDAGRKESSKRIVTESGGGLTWTAVIVGPWFDWAIDAGKFWIDKKSRKITRFGSGDQKISMSRYLATGDFTVAVLKNPERYRNRPAYFASHTVSTNQLITLVEELGLEGWSVADAPINDFLSKGRELWDRDTDRGLRYRLNTPAYIMLGTVSLVDENNRYGADFGDKVEPGWDEGEEVLKESLRKLLA